MMYCIDGSMRCIYTAYMHFSWDETKREANLEAHGFDFVDVKSVLRVQTFTYEDDRFEYEEQRL